MTGGRSWLSSRWSRLPTGPKMLFILTLALLPLGVVAIFASVYSARENSQSRAEETLARLDAKAQVLNDLVARNSDAIRAANAAISYPYTKDVIVSVAGALFALAAFAAARRTVAWLPDTLPRHRIAGTMLIALVSGAWSLQAAAMYLELRSAAYAQRQRWAYAELTLEDDLRRFDARERALFRTLRDEALFAGPEPPPLDLGLDTLLRTE